MSTTEQKDDVVEVQQVACNELEDGEEDLGDVDEHPATPDCLSCNLNEANFFDTTPSLGVGSLLLFNKGYLRK